MGQPLDVACSVIMDSFVNKLPDLDVALSCFPKNKEVQVGAVKETKLPDKQTEILSKGLRKTT